MLKTSKKAPRCNCYLKGDYFLQRPFRLGDTGKVSEGNRKAKLSWPTWNMLDAETTAEISFFHVFLASLNILERNQSDVIHVKRP